MALSISQALKLNGFARASLLTGERGLDHVIETVNIIEAPMEEKWETKKTLFLTSFYAIKDDLNEQIRTIELLAAGESAGLVFQTGILDELPEAVIQRARELGLPIIEIPEEVDYSEVIQPVVSAILQEKTYLLQRSDEIHRQLSTHFCQFKFARLCAFDNSLRQRMLTHLLYRRGQPEQVISVQ